MAPSPRASNMGIKLRLRLKSNEKLSSVKPKGLRHAPQSPSFSNRMNRWAGSGPKGLRHGNSCYRDCMGCRLVLSPKASGTGLRLRLRLKSNEKLSGVKPKGLRRVPQAPSCSNHMNHSARPGPKGLKVENSHPCNRGCMGC